MPEQMQLFTKDALKNKERYFFSGKFGPNEWYILAYDAMLKPPLLTVERGSEGSQRANKRACNAAMDRLCEQYGWEHEGPLSWI